MKLLAATLLLFCLASTVNAQTPAAKAKMPWEMDPIELSEAVGNTRRAEPVQTTVEHNYAFSVRCAKEPTTIAAGALDVTSVDMLYLRWDGSTLADKHYGFSGANPETWDPDETLNVYRPSTKAPVVEVVSDWTQATNGRGRRIDVSLKSAADNELASLIGSEEPISEGTWHIALADSGMTSVVTETTVTYVQGKLSKTSNNVWSKCHLMTADDRAADHPSP